MRRCVRPLLTILAGLLLLQCANRKWENIYDPESPTYPQIEHFAFDGYESYEGWYILVWRLKFIDPPERSYTFRFDLNHNGQAIGGYEDTITPEYIGIMFGLVNWGPYPPGAYKATITYGGEVIHEAEYRVSGSAVHGRPAVDPSYLFDSRKINVR